MKKPMTDKEHQRLVDSFCRFYDEIKKPQIVKDVMSGKFNKKTNLNEYYKGRKIN